MLGDTGRFFPHIQFYSSLSPPQHQLHLGKWVNPNGEVRINSQCSNPVSRDSFWNIELNQASNKDWTFVSITTKNNSALPGAEQITTTFTNLGMNREVAVFPVCLYNQDAFFSSLEINYPILISPIMMVAETLPAIDVQNLYLKNVKEMAIRSGPRYLPFL